MNKKIAILISCLIVSCSLNLFSSGNQESQNRPSRQNNAQNGNNQRPDFEAMAEQLGVTAEDLKDALGEPGQGSPDKLKEAAKLLGVTEQELMEVMGPPPLQKKQ